VLAQPALGVDVDQIDDGAVRCTQRRGGGLGKEEGRACVRGEQLLPLRVGHRTERRREEGTGIVDQSVEPAEMREHGSHQRRRHAGRTQLARQQQHAVGTLLVQLGLEFERLVLGMPVVDRQVVAGAMQAARDFGADALAATGHQCHGPAGLLHFLLPSPFPGYPACSRCPMPSM
jgi:hypothetical protein